MAATLPQPSRPSLNPPKAALPPLPPQGLRKSVQTPFDARISARIPSTSYGSSRLGVQSRFGPSSSPPALVSQHAYSTSNIPTLRSVSVTTTRESSPSGKPLRKPISVASFPQPPKGNTRIPSFSARPPSGSVTPTLSAAPNKKGSWESDRSVLPNATANLTRLSISKIRAPLASPQSDTITPTVSSRAGSSDSEGAGFHGGANKVETHSTFNSSRIPRPSSRPGSQTVTPTSSAPGSRRGSVDLRRPISAGVTGIARLPSISSNSKIPLPSSRGTSQTVTPSSSAPVSRRASVDLGRPVSSDTNALVRKPSSVQATKISRIPSFTSTRDTKAPSSPAGRKRGSSDSSGSIHNGAPIIAKRPSIPRSTRVSSITPRPPAEDIKVMLSAVARQRGSSDSDGSASSGNSVKVKGPCIPRTKRTFRVSSCGQSESNNQPSLTVRKRESSDSDGSANNGSTIKVKRPPPATTKSQTSFLGGNTATLLNSSGAGKLISRIALEAGLPAGSRFSSAPSTTTTQFEDLEDSSADGKSQGANMEKKGNVVVSVRVRPNANGGRVDGEWAVDGRNSVISYRGREGGEYHLDNVFSTTDRNEKIYDACAKRLVRRVMEGYNGTVFAYGMTGTGKTFSMQGTATSLGVIPLAIADIFSYIRQVAHLEFLLRVSYLEIYNEKIYDLLAPPIATGPGAQNEEIKLREDSTRGVYATPLREEVVQSPTQLLRVIAKGDHARRTSSTQFNARSSRSHAVVQIVVESRERTDGVVDTPERKDGAAIEEGGVRVSTLSLIDLAGSERAAESKERRTEGSHINKSLLTLGTVIARLSGATESGGKAADKDGRHLPYRDSKLTRLLQPALSGNSLVSILCTIQCGSAGSAVAASGHVGETLNTLKFAARAKNNIVSHAKRAEAAFANGGDAGTRGLLERYRMEIQNLKCQLERAARDQTDKEEKKLEKESQQRHEEQMLEMHLARVALKERITHLNRLILSSQSTGVNKRGALSSLSAAVDAEGSIHSSGSEDNGSLGGEGDGVASLAAQVHALRADLAERDRYIATLEKRLWQARRASHSRTSIGFSQRASSVPETMESET